MADMIGSGATWLAGQLQASASVEITYTRKLVSITMDATPGATDWSAMTEYAVVNAWVSRDFIFPLTEIDSLSPATPQMGDRITEVGEDGVTRTYDVMAPSGAQSFRLMGTTRNICRVHTKQVN
jgi:hypothetical protein